MESCQWSTQLIDTIEPLRHVWWTAREGCAWPGDLQTSLDPSGKEDDLLNVLLKQAQQEAS